MAASQPIISAPGTIFLEKIVAATRVRLVQLRNERSVDSLVADSAQFTRRSFRAAITHTTPAIISEIKKASPSKGVLRADFDPVLLALHYQTGGGAAYSIVTEPDFFQGDETWIAAVRARTVGPILRKDFVLDPIQVAESAALGADAILLIARLLSVAQMRELHAAASSLSLDVLFEAHDDADLQKLAQCSPSIVGINARNLDTFAVDTEQFVRLKHFIPDGAVAVAESGIESHEQIVSAMQLGYSGFLIGESLVKSSDPAAKLRMLRTGEST